MECIEKGAKHSLIMSGLMLPSGLKMAWMSLGFLLPYTDVCHQAELICSNRLDLMKRLVQASPLSQTKTNKQKQTKTDKKLRIISHANYKTATEDYKDQ